MKIYIDYDFHIYTEENIDDEVEAQLISLGYVGDIEERFFKEYAYYVEEDEEEDTTD